MDFKTKKGLMMSDDKAGTPLDRLIDQIFTEKELGIQNITPSEFQEIDKLTQTILTKHDQKSSHHDGMHQKFAEVLKDVKLGIPDMLVGPTGSGKSTLLKQVAEKLELEYYPMSVNGQTAEYQIIGYKDAIGRYKRTAFREAYEKGGLFSFEEIDAGNPNVLTVINNALSDDFYIFPDKKVRKHKDFRLCASANTYGYGATRQYIGRNPLDAATLNRFAMITVDYDENLEIQIGPVPEWTLFVQALRHTVSCWDNNTPPIIISTRAIVSGGWDIKSGTDWDTVLHKFVWRGVALQPETIGTMKQIDAMKQEAFKEFIKNYLLFKRNNHTK